MRAHLAPHLPNHPLAAEAGPETGVGPVSAAPYGSASILPISWAYVRLMGGEGLRHATQMAVLGANYIAARLREHYPVLYSGHDDLVAHECILDVRQITAETGVTVDDIAKRLVDYGFHAPTMSFPVAGTLMVEPTESENLYELDRFCDAMIAIRGEIEAIRAGEVAVADSMLRHAPHTALNIAGEWNHPYDRTEAAFPVGVARRRQVLAAGQPHRRCLRRPQPRLLLPAAGGLRGLSPRRRSGHHLPGPEPRWWPLRACHSRRDRECGCLLTWEPTSSRPGTRASSGSSTARRCAATSTCSSACSARASSSSTDR